MQLLEKKHALRNGGSCANCDASYSGYAYDGLTAYRCYVRYDRITEPMNICEKCIDQL